MIADGSIWLSILKGGAMDFSKLTLGSKIVAGSGILMLVDSFFHWQSVSYFTPSMWHGWGVLAGLTLLAILAWEAVQLTETKIAVGPLSPSMVTMLLAALLVLFTLIKVLEDDVARTTWAWIGLLLAIGVGVGSWLNMQEAGESFGDLMTSVTPSGSSAPSAPADEAAPADPPAAPEAVAEAPAAEPAEGQPETT
jgi:hypothetical protein